MSLKRTRSTRHEVATTESEIQNLLGPPALCAGETAENYNNFYSRIRLSVAPRDAIEELWVRDIVDLAWDSQRLRRLKAKLLFSARSLGLSLLLDRAVRDVDDDDDETDEDDPDLTRGVSYIDKVAAYKEYLHTGWLSGNQECRKEINRIFEQAGYDWQVVEAEAFSARLDEFERFDRLIAQADTRRAGALQQIENNRATLARRLRDGVTDIEDAEFEDVPKRKAAE